MAPGILLVTSLGALDVPIAASAGMPAPPYTTTYYVDTNNPACSDAGTEAPAERPFCTIGRATEVVSPGSQVLIRGGVYREEIRITTSGTDAEPIAFEAYNGEDVTLDGSVLIGGWTPCPSAAACFGNPNWQSIYTTTVGFDSDKLFENDVLMTNAREPDFGYFRSAKSQTDKSVYSDAITQSPDYYVGAMVQFQGTSTTAEVDWNNLVYDKYYVTAAEPGRLHVDYSDMTPLWGHTFEGSLLDELWFYVRNKVQYIDRPGEWAFVDYLGEAPYTVYFWAPSGDPNASRVELAFHNALVSASDLIENVSFGGIGVSKVNKYPAANKGSAFALNSGARRVTIEGCTIRFAEKAIEMRRADGVTIRNSVIKDNYDGIVIGSGRAGPVGDPATTSIEQNEIGPNDGDGIQVYSEANIVIRDNHIHHHYSDRKHADNVQASYVRNWVLENNLIHDGGQNVILQNTAGAVVRNNVIYNSHACSLVFDSDTNDGLQLVGNTLGYSYRSLVIKFSHATLKDNIYAIGDHIPQFPVHDYLDRIDASDYNYYADYVTHLVDGSSWTAYTIPEWQALGFDQHSVFGGGGFANIPEGVHLVDFRSFYARDDIKVGNASSTFSVGDVVEYVNDGVPRTVTSVDEDSIGIDPPLDYDTIGSKWGNYVVHWGQRTNITEDYTPSGSICTASETGSHVGAIPCAVAPGLQVRIEDASREEDDSDPTLSFTVTLESTDP
jgi:hypothetical protein